MSEVDDFLNSGDYESHDPFNFDEVGTAIQGTIIGTPRLVDVDDTFAGKIKKLVIDVASESAGERSIWVKPNHGLQRAIAEAVKKAEASGLAEGGTLRVKREPDAEPTKPGHKGAHVFRAEYAPPAPAAVSAESDDWG